MARPAYVTRHPNLRLLAWFNFFFNFRLYSGVASIYFATITHSYALALSVPALAQIAQALCEVPTGIYSDRLGRRTCLILGAGASALAILCYAAAQGYGLLALGAGLEGACLALFSGNNDALLYETLAASGQQATYPAALGRVSSTLELAGFLGVVAGGGLAAQSLGLLLWLSVLPQVVCFALSFRFREPAVPRDPPAGVYQHLKESLGYYRSNPRLRDLSLAAIIGMGVGGAQWVLLPVFYNRFLPVWAVSLVISLNFLSSTIGFRLSGGIIARFKALPVLIFSDLYSRILVLGAVLYPTGVSPFLIALGAVTYAPSEVAKNSLLQQEFSARQRATLASINSLLGSGFYAGCALLLGWLADHGGAAQALFVAQIALLPMTVLYLRVFRAGRQPPR